MKSKAAGLIVDMQLGGMSGLELGYQLSAMGLTLPIIFVTGSQDKKLHADALEFGCVAICPSPFKRMYWPRPLRMPLVSSLVRRHLRGA